MFPGIKHPITIRLRKKSVNITDDYLTNINSGYYDFFKSRPDIKVKYIDVSEIDFVEDLDKAKELVDSDWFK